MKTNEINMAQGPLLKKLISLSLPIIFIGILQTLYTSADMVVVGRFAGSDPLAAVGATNPLINICVGAFLGISTGAGIVAAQFYGAKQEKDMHNTVHTSIALGIVCGFILTVIGIILTPVLLKTFDTPENVLHLSVTYMRIYFLGSIPSLIYNFGSAVLRAIGDTKISLIFLTISGIVNVIFNLIFVIGFKMGVVGVAAATVISQVISAVLIVVYMLRLKNWCRLVPKDIKIKRRYLSKILYVGIPSALQSVVFSLSNSVIQSAINSFGSTVIAGNTAAVNIETFTYFTMNGIATASATASGQITGAGDAKRIDKLLITSTLFVSGCGFFISFLLYIFGPQLLGIYTSDPLAIEAGLSRMSIIMLTHFMCGIMEVTVCVLRGMGNSVLPMISSIIGSCLLRVIWVKTIFKAFPTLTVLYSCYPVTWLVIIVTNFIFFMVVRRKFRMRLEMKNQSLSNLQSL